MGLEHSLVLGRYRVLWPLEQQRLVKSYIARDEHRDGSGAPVLLKHFRHDIGDEESPAARALFDDLARLTHLRHPGVVALLDFGAVDHTLITVHSQRQGVDLATFCDHFERRERPFPPRLALYVARCVARTLAECHSEGIVHGRITLAAVYLPRTGEPQISDFSLAGVEDVASQVDSELGFFQTRMSYSAPEVTRGESPSARGDLYSVALLLYRLLAGNNPFRGRSVPETLQRVMRLEPAELLIPEWEGCGALNEILRRALDKDPTRRYADCAELEADLAKLQGPPDAIVAQELRSLIREHFSADWAQIARLTRRRSLPPTASGPTDASGARASISSRAPAFASGLITQQPVSVSEHTLQNAREGHAERAPVRRPRRRLERLSPGILVPALAITCGLLLGRLLRPPPPGVASASESAPAPVQLSDGSIDALKARLDACTPQQPGTSEPPRRVELEFESNGSLSAVRLDPESSGRTRFGACLLASAWEAKPVAPGALSLVIPVKVPR